jgi:purine catabolism regulator
VAGLATALRESAAAALHAAAGAVVDSDQLGVAALLAGMHDADASRAFAARMLGPVLDHDAAGSPSLIATLRAYVEHGCRPGPAAAELRIHRHTLAYRLDRIATLTGRDPRDGAHLTSYGVALEILRSAGDGDAVTGTP